MLRAAWRSAAAGRPGVVLVRGGPGVGKSRLVTEVAEAARRAGGRGRRRPSASRTSGRLALAPVADVAAQHRGAGRRSAGLDPVWREEVDRLVPSDSGWRRPRARAHGRRLAAAPLLRGAGPGAARRRTSDAAGPRQRAVVRPGDAGLPHLLPGLCRRALPCWSRRPCATTAGPDDAALADWVARMRASGLLTELALGPFDDADTARLGRGAARRSARRTGARAAGRGHRAVSRCTSSRRCARCGRRIRSRPGTSPPCCATGSTRPARRRRRSPGSPRRSAGTSRSTCSSRPPTWTPTAVVAAVDELWRRRILRERGDRLRLLPRPAARRRLRPGQPAAALAAAPARRPGPRAAARRRPRPGGRAAGRAVRPRRPARAGRRLLPARGRRGGGRVRPRRGDPAALRRAGDRAAAARRGATATAASWPSWRPWRRRSTPGTATRRTSCEAVMERSVELAESLGRGGLAASTALVGLWSSRFVQGRSRARTRRRPGRSRSRTRLRAERRGALRVRRVGDRASVGRPRRCGTSRWPRRVGTGCSLSVGTRTDVHSRAWAAHAHWLRGDDAAAQASSREAVALARSLDHPYSLAVALAYAAMPISCAATGPGCEAGRRAARALRPVRVRLLPRVGAGARRAGRAAGAPGVDLARRGDREPARRRRARAHALLAVAARPTCSTGPAHRRRPASHPRRRRRRRAQARDDVWWLPEVLRMRAAYDERRRRRRVPAAGGRRPGRRSTAASRCCGAASATSPRAASRAFAGVQPARPERRGERSAERCANAAFLASAATVTPSRTPCRRSDDHHARSPRFDELTAALRGELITPADPRYDEARAVYNGMIDKRPAAIARCRDVADVVACVRFAREHDLTLAVRGGGHSAAGLGVWDDALVVDLVAHAQHHRRPRAAAPSASTPAPRWGDLDHATVRVRAGRPRRASSPPPASPG